MKIAKCVDDSVKSILVLDGCYWSDGLENAQVYINC